MLTSGLYHFHYGYIQNHSGVEIALQEKMEEQSYYNPLRESAS